MKNLYQKSRKKYKDKKYLIYEKRKLSNISSTRIDYINGLTENSEYKVFSAKPEKFYINKLFCYSENKKLLFEYFENR